MAITHLSAQPMTAESQGTAIDSIEGPEWTPDAGDNRYLHASAAGSATVPPSILAMKWGGASGTPMNFISDVVTLGSALHRLALYGLIAPDAGPHRIFADWASIVDEGVVGGAVWGGVDQKNPISVPVTGNGDQFVTPQIIVESGTNEVVVDAVVVADCSSISPGSFQTNNYKDDTIGGANWSFGSSRKAGLAGLVYMSWFEDGFEWCMCGIALKPVAGPSFSAGRGG